MTTLTGQQALAMSYNVTTGWIAQLKHIPAEKVDTSKTLDDFGISGGLYLTMCNEISATLNRAAGKIMVLDGAWRAAQMDKKVLDFIGALALKLMNSTDAPVAQKAKTFVSGAGKKFLK